MTILLLAIRRLVVRWLLMNDLISRDRNCASTIEGCPTTPDQSYVIIIHSLLPSQVLFSHNFQISFPVLRPSCIMEANALNSVLNAPRSQFIPCPTTNRRQHATTSAPPPPTQFNPKQRERLLKRRQAREDLLRLLRARPPVLRPILGPGCMRYPRGPDGRFLDRGRNKMQDVQIEKTKPKPMLLEKSATRSAVQVRPKL
jgi:hypothetical protein